MKQGITTHTVVRNEDRYIWFSLMSVMDLVDQMFVYDTGSTDSTAAIVKSIKSSKIIFKRKGKVDKDKLVRLRQEQIDKTMTEWFLILDGDEVWWKKSITEVKKLTTKVNKNIWGIITPTINCVGDIFHYQEEKAGNYEFAGKKGHLAVRMMRRTIPGLHVEGNYPLEGFIDDKGVLISDYDDRLVFLDQPYLHLTNLSRSTSNSKNVLSRDKKYELGIPFPKDFEYPEIFKLERPDIVPSPWKPMSRKEKLRSAVQTPAKRIKRRILP